MATWWNWLVPLPRNFVTHRFSFKGWENDYSFIIEIVSYVFDKTLEQQRVPMQTWLVLVLNTTIVTELWHKNCKMKN